MQISPPAPAPILPDESVRVPPCTRTPDEALAGPPRLPPRLARPTSAGSATAWCGRRRQCASARGPREKTGNEWTEERALQRMFANNTELSALYQDSQSAGQDGCDRWPRNRPASARSYSHCSVPRARTVYGRPASAGDCSRTVRASQRGGPLFDREASDDVIVNFLQGLSPDEGSDAIPGDTAVRLSQTTVGLPAEAVVVEKGSRGSSESQHVNTHMCVARLGRELAEVKTRGVRLDREKKRLQDAVAERDERVKQLEEDLKRVRSEPQMLNPAVQRLKKIGLNTPTLAELGERWAGYVLGRTSMAMEVGSYPFRSVFSMHARNGVLTEESFKNVIRQFDPAIKCDQLTRLWFFADTDGSGQLDLFEFMRIFGSNSNGEMSDEFYEVLTIHLYRKFHSRGGARRVHQSADKDQDQCLTLEDWTTLLAKFANQDPTMTKQEMHQIFHRMNTSNTGLLTVNEFEAALESAASKCCVSERWVRETFQATAVAIQTAGYDLRQLVPAPTISSKDFRDLMLKLNPRLRSSQIERLWKFVEAGSQNSGPRPPTSNDAICRIDTEVFLKIAFAPAFCVSLAELPAGSGDCPASHADGGAADLPAPHGTGRELLEQLAHLLRQRVGDASLDRCFDVLNPFVTPEYFHHVLKETFALQYDMMKTKQVFGLIDMDRDGRITRYEFVGTLKRLSQAYGGSEASEVVVDGGVDSNMKAQVHRLQNRVLVLENEISQLKSPMNRMAGALFLGDVVSTVPERQYQQLSQAHLKVTETLERVRSQLAAKERHILVSSNTVNYSQTDEQALTNSQRKRRRSVTLTSLPAIQDGLACACGNVYMDDANYCRKCGLRRWNKVDSPVREAPWPEEARTAEARGTAGADDDDRSARCAELERQVARLHQERLQLEDDFAARTREFVEQNEAFQETICSLRKAIAAKDDEQAKASANIGLAKTHSAVAHLVESSAEETLTAMPLPQSHEVWSPTFSRRAHRSKSIGASVREPVSDHKAPRRHKSQSHPPSQFSFAIAPAPLINGAHATSASISTEPLVTQEIVPAEAIGPVRRALREFATGPSDSQSIRKRRDVLRNCLLGSVVHDRFRIVGMVSASADTVFTSCHDLLLNKPVAVKMLVDLHVRSRRNFAHEMCVMSMLASVPNVTTIYHFSGANSCLVFAAMELLQGESLAVRFEAVQDERAAQVTFLEAMEIADGLLMGVDACHQHQALNLGLRPDTVWIAPPLSGTRVRLIDWQHAQLPNLRTLSPEVAVLAQARQHEQSEIIPTLTHGTNDSTSCATSSVQTRIGVCSQDAVKLPGAGRPFPNLCVKNGSALYYMASEQLYRLIASNEAEQEVQSKWEWSSQRTGAGATITGRIVHWCQNSDGVVQTAMPVALLPLGHFFEVEVHKVKSMVRHPSSHLGFRIGFTTSSPAARSSDSMDAQSAVLSESWLAGGDCAYYICGKRMAASRSNLEDRVPVPFSTGDACTEDDGCVSEDEDCGGRYICPKENLRREDRIGVLTEWSGDISIFVNGECVGRCPKAMHASQAARQLYGVVDVYSGQRSDDFHVRAVMLCSESKTTSSMQGTPHFTSMANELRYVDQLIHSSMTIPLGPSCDVYACALIILQCFRGGQEVVIPEALELFHVAFSIWVSAQCPLTHGEYYLLSAIRGLLNEKEAELVEVASLGVRCVLARALRRSRYSRLASCLEFATMLNEATGWQGMTAEFLGSHVAAVEEAARLQEAEGHAAASRGDDLAPATAEEGFETAAAADDAAPLVPCVPAVWDLRSLVLGHSHLTRVVHVLSGWDRRGLIRAVALSNIMQQIPPTLQSAFVARFSTQEVHREGEKVSARARVSSSIRAAVRESGATDCLPTLFLDDIPLPADSLPRERFSLGEIIRRHLLWLVVHFVRKLDFQRELPLPGECSPLALGASHDLVVELAGAIAKSVYITQLNLRSSELGERGGLLLAAAMTSCMQLRWLGLEDNDLGPKAAAKFVESAQAGHNLTALDLTRNSIGDAGARMIAEVLPSCRFLTDIRLRLNVIGSDGVEALAECLLSNSSLSSVDLGANDIHLGDLVGLLRVTVASCTLHELNLEHSVPWPPFEGAEGPVCMLADALGGHAVDRSHGPSGERGAFSCLRSLNLRHCGINGTSAARLFSALAHNNKLELLNLSWNGIRQHGTLEIAEMLAASHSAITELDLRDNHLGTQDALAEALQRVFWRTGHIHHTTNSRLRVLHLGNNELTAKAICLFVESLPAFSGLEELFLYHNPKIGSEGAQALARLLALGPTGVASLRRLSLAVCGLGDQGCRSLAGALHINDRLTALDVSGNRATDHTAVSFAEALSKNDVLEELNLAINSIGDDGLQHLASAIDSKRCSAIRLLDLSAQSGGCLEPPCGLDGALLAVLKGIG